MGDRAGGRRRTTEGDLEEMGVSRKTTWRRTRQTMLGLLGRKALHETEFNFNKWWESEGYDAMRFFILVTAVENWVFKFLNIEVFIFQ